MNVFWRRLRIGALLLITLCTSCNLPALTPTPVGTIIPVTQVTSTALPTGTASLETPSAEIPVTGLDEVSMQCQFCVNDEPHAVLVLPERVSFFTPRPPGFDWRRNFCSRSSPPRSTRPGPHL